MKIQQAVEILKKHNKPHSVGYEYSSWFKHRWTAYVEGYDHQYGETLEVAVEKLEASIAVEDAKRNIEQAEQIIAESTKFLQNNA